MTQLEFIFEWVHLVVHGKEGDRMGYWTKEALVIVLYEKNKIWKDISLTLFVT